ncbi:MAG: M48 family metalloprotease [Saprospirales bacterium]|nr:M48 family metalloprotease [Saprospirales bacterium]
MDKRSLIRQNIAGYFISGLSLVLIGGLIFFVVRDALIRSFTNGLWQEMYGMELVIDPETGHQREIPEYDMSEAFDYARSEDFSTILMKRYQEASFLFILFPALLLLVLLLARGWSNVKGRVRPLDLAAVFPDGDPGISGMEKVKWYLGRATFSYGFAIRRIVLGADFLMNSSPENRRFLIQHERAHLKFRDSVVKNFLINTRKFFLPVFYIVMFFTALLSALAGMLFVEGVDIDEVEEPGPWMVALILMYLGMAIVYFFLFRQGFRFLQHWFSYAKEFIADRIAAIRIGSVPDISHFKADQHHPPGDLRWRYANGANRVLSIYPLFFFIAVLQNINFFGTGSFGFSFTQLFLAWSL